MNMGSSSAAGAAMTDADRLHVFITGNQGEVLTSRPVVGELTNPQARQFAQEMISAHTGVVEQAQALDLEPRNNPVSLSMTQMVEGVARTLDGMSGAMLDMKYMEAQVTLHGQTLNMLDYVLIPNTRDAAARRLMEQARPAVADHLRRAQAIHHEMMTANPPAR